MLKNRDKAASKTTDINKIANLKQAVQSTLAAFFNQRHSHHGDVAADVYRTLRDEANLLLERQFIWDALDSDPFEMMRVSGDDDGDDDQLHADGIGNREEETCKTTKFKDGEDLVEKRKNAEVIDRLKVWYGSRSMAKFCSMCLLIFSHWHFCT